MRIRELKISNFRGIQDSTIGPLSPITGIWGPNGSGKSAALHAVVCFKHYVLNRGQYGGYPPQLNQGGLSLGGWENVFWRGGAVKSPLRIVLHLADGSAHSMELSSPQNQPQLSQPVPDVAPFRYFPANRALLNRTSDVQSSPAEGLGIAPAQVHPFVHWFYHQKVRERQLTGKPNEVDRIDGWMTKVGFGPLSDRLSSPGQIYAQFSDPITDYQTPFLDGGFGGLVFAPLLLESYSFRDGLILVEEPEISLHPAAQADMFDFFLEMARDRGHQILFTSHSTYLLSRFARFMREAVDDRDLVGVVTASKDSAGSHFLRAKPEELVARMEKKQPLLPELQVRVSGEPDG